MAKKKLETQTCGPLTAQNTLDLENPRAKLLNKMFDMAMDGNTTAAKVYLDYSEREEDEQDESGDLTVDLAMKIIHDQGELFASTS